MPSIDPLARFRDRLSLPLIAAPMFLVSGVELVVAACRNGVIGSFPTVNCRSPEQLVKQTSGKHHQYPDGFGLFLGTMFAPVVDREAKGLGFTHKQNDMVRVSTELLGMLENKVTTCDQAPAWTFGIGELMKNLARRGML